MDKSKFDSNIDEKDLKEATGGGEVGTALDGLVEYIRNEWETGGNNGENMTDEQKKQKGTQWLLELGPTMDEENKDGYRTNLPDCCPPEV